MLKNGKFLCDHCGASGPLIYVEGLEVCKHCAETMIKSANDEINVSLERIRR